MLFCGKSFNKNKTLLCNKYNYFTRFTFDSLKQKCGYDEDHASGFEAPYYRQDWKSGGITEFNLKIKTNKFVGAEFIFFNYIKPF